MPSKPGKRNSFGPILNSWKARAKVHDLVTQAPARTGPTKHRDLWSQASLSIYLILSMQTATKTSMVVYICWKLRVCLSVLLAWGQSTWRLVVPRSDLLTNPVQGISAQPGRTQLLRSQQTRPRCLKFSSAHIEEVLPLSLILSIRHLVAG